MNLFQKAIQGQAVKTPPIWCMRQAGRYHRHYQNLRAKYSFMDLCKKPDIAAEVALGPVADFDFDAAILFSDLLFPLEVLGMGLEYKDSGPEIGWLLENSKDLKKLRSPKTAIQDLEFQAEALVKTRKLIGTNKGLIGFVGGAYTLLMYASTGSHKNPANDIKAKLPDLSGFYEYLLPLLEMNIDLQLKAGADVVMLFDTASGELAPNEFKTYALDPVSLLARKFPGKLGYYSKGTNRDHFVDCGDLCKDFLGFGVDHRWKLHELLKSRVLPGFLQGNFDQQLLFGEMKDFSRRLEEWLAPLSSLSAEQRKGWICGLGHGVLPKTPEENVRHFVKQVRSVFT